jgi:hypothetical protein
VNNQALKPPRDQNSVNYINQRKRKKKKQSQGDKNYWQTNDTDPLIYRLKLTFAGFDPKINQQATIKKILYTQI